MGQSIRNSKGLEKKDGYYVWIGLELPDFKIEPTKRIIVNVKNPYQGKTADITKMGRFNRPIHKA